MYTTQHTNDIHLKVENPACILQIWANSILFQLHLGNLNFPQHYWEGMKKRNTYSDKLPTDGLQLVSQRHCSSGGVELLRTSSYAYRHQGGADDHWVGHEKWSFKKRKCMEGTLQYPRVILKIIFMYIEFHLDLHAEEKWPRSFSSCVLWKNVSRFI